MPRTAGRPTLVCHQSRVAPGCCGAGPICWDGDDRLRRITSGSTSYLTASYNAAGCASPGATCGQGRTTSPGDRGGSWPTAVGARPTRQGSASGKGARLASPTATGWARRATSRTARATASPRRCGSMPSGGAARPAAPIRTTRARFSSRAERRTKRSVPAGPSPEWGCSCSGTGAMIRRWGGSSAATRGMREAAADDVIGEMM